MWFLFVNEDEVTKIINFITSNASDVDSVSIDMIKYSIPVITPYLKDIINYPNERATFSKLWKTSLVNYSKEKSVQKFQRSQAYKHTSCGVEGLGKGFDSVADVACVAGWDNTRKSVRRGYNCEAAIIVKRH